MFFFKGKREEKTPESKREFSQTLLVQESLLIWISTLAFIGLAYYCVINQFFGELPWVATMIGFPWTAYGVSQACYYSKSKRQNTQGGITYDTAMLQLQHQLNNPPTVEEVIDESYNGLDDSEIDAKG